VHDWHVVRPAAVEYWPTPQAVQDSPVRRNPASQILEKQTISGITPCKFKQSRLTRSTCCCWVAWCPT
jgi:hypothetical protein